MSSTWVERWIIRIRNGSENQPHNGRLRYVSVWILALSFFNKPTRQVPQQQTAPFYEPSPEVIKQNNGFQFALNAAPNVLYQRYKQYGQVCTSNCLPCLRRSTDAPKVRCPGMVFRVQ